MMFRNSKILFSPDDPAQPSSAIATAKTGEAPKASDTPNLSNEDVLYGEVDKQLDVQTHEDGVKRDQNGNEIKDLGFDDDSPADKAKTEAARVAAEAAGKVAKEARDYLTTAKVSVDGKTDEEIVALASVEKTKAEEAIKAAEATAKAAKEKEAGEKVAARKKAYDEAKTPEDRKKAYDALTDGEKKPVYDAMSEDDRKALGIGEPPPAVPEYQEFTLPEGVALDGGAMTQALDIFKEIKGAPTQEQAQKLVSIYADNAVKFAQQVVKDVQVQQAENFVNMRKDWVAAIKADPEVGGKNYDTSNSLVALARDHFIPEKERPAFIQALETTGAGDNLSLFKYMVAVGKAIKDDKLVSVTGAGDDPDKSASEVMYGS